MKRIGLVCVLLFTIGSSYAVENEVFSLKNEVAALKKSGKLQVFKDQLDQSVNINELNSLADRSDLFAQIGLHSRLEQISELSDIMARNFAWAVIQDLGFQVEATKAYTKMDKWHSELLEGFKDFSQEFRSEVEEKFQNLPEYKKNQITHLSNVEIVKEIKGIFDQDQK